MSTLLMKLALQKVILFFSDTVGRKPTYSSEEINLMRHVISSLVEKVDAMEQRCDRLGCECSPDQTLFPLGERASQNEKV